MNLHRVSKKNAHHDTRETVDSLHSKKMEEFEKLYATLPDKRERIGRIGCRKCGYSGKW